MYFVIRACNPSLSIVFIILRYLKFVKNVLEMKLDSKNDKLQVKLPCNLQFILFSKFIVNIFN